MQITKSFLAAVLLFNANALATPTAATDAVAPVGERSPIEVNTIFSYKIYPPHVHSTYMCIIADQTCLGGQARALQGQGRVLPRPPLPPGRGEEERRQGEGEAPGEGQQEDGCPGRRPLA